MLSPDIAGAIGVVRAVLKKARVSCEIGKTDTFRLLLGCSGGRDSMALLGLLMKIAERDRISVVVGHINHNLRQESEEESNYVHRVSAQLEVTCVSTRLQLKGGPGLPARAREARHAALREMRKDYGAHVIALAHTATDQAETMLLNLTRGTGLTGLAGMQDVEDEQPVVRPLLSMPRSATAPLCGLLGLQYVDDPTNQNTNYPRVMVREVVLPALAGLRGGVEEAFASTAVIAREAEDAVRQWVQHELHRRWSHQNRGVTLDGWRNLPRAVRIGMVRAMLLADGAAVDAVGRRALETVDRSLLQRGGCRQWEFSGGVRLVTCGKTLSVQKSP